MEGEDYHSVPTKSELGDSDELGGIKGCRWVNTSDTIYKYHFLTFRSNLYPLSSQHVTPQSSTIELIKTKHENCSFNETKTHNENGSPHLEDYL